MKDNIASTPMQHSKHGPSKHPYLVKCHAYRSDSTVPVEDAEADDGGYHAVRGTFLHDLVYQLLHGKVKEAELYEITKTPCGKYEITEKDIDYVFNAAVQTTRAIKLFLEKMGVEKYYELSECWVDLECLGIEGGTPDGVAIAGFAEYLLVWDYKFGMKEVSPWTEQLMSYSYGLIQKRQITRVFHVIIQPAIRDIPWGCEIPLERIQKHGKMMKSIIESADAPNPPMTPHTDCPYCSKYPCSGVDAMTRNAGGLAKQNIDLVNISDDRLDEYGLIATSLKKFSASVMGEIGRRLALGATLPHWCMRPGKKKRSWNCSEDAERGLRLAIDVWNEREQKKDRDKQRPLLSYTDLFVVKMLSPSKADTMLGRSVLIKEITSCLEHSKEGSLTVQEKKDAE